MKGLHQFFSVFNNREIASITWGIIFIGGALIWSLREKDFRQLFSKGLKPALSTKILLSIFSLIAYVLFIVLILKHVGLWTLNNTKVTVFWFFGTAISLLFRSPDALDNATEFYKQIVKDNISLIIVIHFVVNTHTFHIGIEFILVFVTTVLLMIKGYLEGFQKEGSLTKFTNYSLALIGAIILGFSIYGLGGNFQNYLSLNQWKGLLLPPIMTVSLILFLYPYTLLMGYENAFTMLSFGFNDERSLEWFTRLQVFKKCKFNLRKLNEFREEYVPKLTGLHDKKEIIDTIQELDKASEENLPDNDIWSEDEELVNLEAESKTIENLAEEERKQIWVDLTRATDRAMVEANIEYPMTIEEITAEFTFQSDRKIIIENDKTEWEEVPPGSKVEIKERRKIEDKLEFYIQACQNGNKIAEGWIEKSWLINQGISFDKDMQKNSKLATQLEEKYCNQVRKKYGIDKETERKIFSEAMEKEWTHPELPTIDQYLSEMS